jgi:tetratricopeptide (TPR) repeat protein
MPPDINNVQHLEEHLKKHPDSLLFARLADAYLKNKRTSEAIQVCEEGIKKHPYYVTGHMMLGKCYLANKMYDYAEKEFKRVILLDSKYPAAHKFYGDLMEEIGWENTCESSYKKILQIDPLDEVARSRVREFDSEGESDFGAAATPKKSITEPEIDFEPPRRDSAGETDWAIKSSSLQMNKGNVEEGVTELDDKNAEEFAGILDDIFKEEVVQEESQPAAPESDFSMEEDDLVSEIQRNPDNYFQNYKDFDSTLRPPESPPKHDLDDFEALHFQPKIREKEQSSPALPHDDDEILPTPSKSKKPGDKIVTPTLGEIYAAQGQFAKAIDVFELLLRKHPQNEVYAQKIKILKQKLEEAKNAAKD